MTCANCAVEWLDVGLCRFSPLLITTRWIGFGPGMNDKTFRRRTQKGKWIARHKRQLRIAAGFEHARFGGLHDLGIRHNVGECTARSGQLNLIPGSYISEFAEERI